MLDAAPSLSRTGVRPTLNAARLRHWMRFDRRDLGLAITLAAASTVINTSGSLGFMRGGSLLEIAEFAGSLFFNAIILYGPLVAALEALERLPIKGWRRHLATIATSMTLAAVIAGVRYYSVDWQHFSAGLKYGISSSPLALLLNTIWQAAALALIARAWLVKSREETHASKLLAGIRSEQMLVRRRLVEGRLKAIQARVDPLFFFDMLEAVQKTYTINTARAEQLLDELTAFLRAALPRLRTASSTVDQECELASSFARLRVLAGLGKSRLDFDIPPSVGVASFPPGVLLPLVDELLRATADGESVGVSFATLAAGAPTDRLAAPISGGAQSQSARQTLVMQLTARTNSSMAVLAGARTLLDGLGATADARAILLDLFGANSDLASIAIYSGVRTTVRVPYEPASA